MEEVIAASPEILIAMPCGCGTEEAIRQVSEMLRRPGWEGVPAVRLNRIYAVDASRFSRPALRLVEGVELLAHLLHPDEFEWRGPAEAYRPVVSTIRENL
jgi:iron complex transport system substrate-binding protein